VAILHKGERFDGKVERMTPGGKPVVRINLGSSGVAVAESVVTRGNWSVKEGKWFSNVVTMERNPKNGNLSEARWRCELISVNRTLARLT